MQPPQSLFQAFRDAWHCQPAAVAQAPGRVNLIGEHIDYEGYGVMPMAVEQACHIAVAWQPSPHVAASDDNLPGSRQTPVLHVANVAADQYPAGVLAIPPEGQLPGDTPAWLAYIWAALKGCMEFAASKQHAVLSCGNIVMMADSSIPPAAGLSSSSALVVATALALLELWQLPATSTEVAEFTCRCERYVGTQGGGMDQAASLLAQAGQALHVEFNPVRAVPVPLPPGCVVVVANSLARSAKAETASHRFNLRVLECQLASMLLAKQLSGVDGSSSTRRDAGQLPALDWRQVSILHQVEPHLLHCARSHLHGALAGVNSSSVQLQLSKAVQSLLPQHCYQFDQVAELLNVSRQELLDLLRPALQTAAAAASKLHLQQRALHVYAEAQRVLQFKQVCLDQQLPCKEKLLQLGELLNASHSSCAGLYQCSCEELDKLVDTAKAAGALGARLTGAGWGGCTVSLVREEDAPKFIAQLREQYFIPLVDKGVVKEQELSECLFASKPSSGAAVMQLQLAVGPDAEAATTAVAAGEAHVAVA